MTRAGSPHDHWQSGALPTCGALARRPSSAPRSTRYMRWLETERGLAFADYDGSGAGRSRSSRRSGSRSGTSSTSAPSGPTSACSRDRSMPGARWFEGAELSYAEHIFRGKPDDRVARGARLGAARAGRGHLGRAAPRRPHGSPPGLRVARRRARRPRRRLHAEHPRDPRRLPRVREPRRRVVELLARLRGAERGGPLRPDRAEGAARGRRLPLQRPRLRPHGDRGRPRGARCPSLERTVVLPYLDPEPDLGRARARDALGRR